jgi:hypothetical protein
VIADVSVGTLKAGIRVLVDKKVRILTDDLPSYQRINGAEYAGGRHTVAHSTTEYIPGDTHTSTAESLFALLKRGIVGIYQFVSKKCLRRYLW